MQAANLLSHTHLITCGNTNRAEIALTFDDGPYPPYTFQILDVLRFYGVQATFFCIGQQIERFPEVVEQMQKEGHLVENHTWSHATLTEVSDPQEVFRELARCTEIIEHVTGVTPTFFRPPNGRYDSQALHAFQANRLIPVLWNVDPRDWKQPGADAISQQVIEQTNKGAIILLHDGGGDRTGTVEALPRIIQWASQRHLHCVTLRQLIDRPPFLESSDR